MNKIIILFIIFPVILISLIQCSKQLNPTKSSVSICFVGDIIPHKYVLKHHEKYNPMALITNIIKQHDIAFGNLEGPSASPTLKHDHYRAFNAPPEFLKTLKNSGFSVLNIANNHILDCTYRGVGQTIRQLKKQGFYTTGYTIKQKPILTIIKTNDIKIGFMGFSTLINYMVTNQYVTNVSYFEKLDNSFPFIRRAENKVDFLIISIHWGEEYSTNYLELKKYARQIFKNGADCIIGHHPHILLPLEYDKKSYQFKNIVAYSLGNFLANIGRNYRFRRSHARKGAPRRTIILSLRVDKTGGETVTTEIKVHPVWIYNNFINYRNTREKEIHIYSVPIKSAPDSLLPAAQKRFELKQIYHSIKYEEEDNIFSPSVSKVIQ